MDKTYTVDPPKMPGAKLVHMESDFTLSDAIATIHSLGCRSPSFDGAESLLAAYPKLHDFPPIAAQLKKAGRRHVLVLVALEETTKWIDARGVRYVGLLYSGYDRSCLRVIPRYQKFRGGCWLLAVEKPF